MPAITGTEVCQAAFTLLNKYSPGEAMSPADGAMALEFLNDWLSEQSQKTMMTPAISRNRFDLVAGQGSISNPYTIGEGADFDVIKPSNQNSITAANLILTASSPEVRVPLGIFTDDAYDANRIPDLANIQPTGLYYQQFTARTTDDWGYIYLWPVPNVATNDLEIFIQQSLLQFADLSTTYYVPDGVPRMLKYNLADILQVIYGKTLSPRAIQMAVSSLRTFKASNAKLSDLMNDAYMFAEARQPWNILTGP